MRAPSPSSTIFLDLDGPILECKMRHYACYLDLCRSRELRPLERDEYWELKRQRVKGATLFQRSGARGDGSDLMRSWIDLVEQPGYLALDAVHPWVCDVLSSWVASGARLCLATLRSNVAGLHAELESLGLRRFFDRVVTSDSSAGGEGKAAAVARDRSDIDPRSSVWIGDTEVDAVAAARLGVNVYLVTCGIRTEEYLRSLGTGEVVSDLRTVRERLTV
jgi:phosphoglycolate phosphatase-like HAD superfamily hydrolase